MKALLELDAERLRSLADALAGGRLVAPFTPLAVQRIVGASAAPGVADDLGVLGAPPAALAPLLQAIAHERGLRADQARAVELVVSGAEVSGVPCRDTATVMRELFACAERELLVVGYAVHRGREVFRVLGERMDANPDLHVQLFLDVRRGPGDTSIGDEIAFRFAQHFVRNQWPAKRMPEVYYDPRALAEDHQARAALHAKCVVVDRRITLVTSANLTVAAQEKNLEVGLRVDSLRLSEHLVLHFEGLQRAHLLRRLPLPNSGAGHSGSRS